jgi:hypothetical protein
MKILLRPVFENVEEGEYYGMLSMRQPNQDALDGELRAYLNEIFPEPGRAIERVRGTNFYLVDVLNDNPDNIKTWYDTHLADALARGFVVDRDWEIFPKDERQPVDEGVGMYLDTLANYSNMGFDFDTEEGRENVYGFTMVEDNLEGVLLPDLYAQGFDYIGQSFAKSKLMNSVFRKAFLQLVNFQNANLTGVDFQEADLRYAFFQGADLTGANFQGANLTGANFNYTNWQEALNLIDNPTFTAPARQLVLEQEEEDDEALEGDKNTCYAVTDLYDKNIDKYLAKDPGNFILVVGDNKECESLVNLQLQYYSKELRDMEGYYECSQSVIDWQNTAGHTKLAFNPEDYITDIEYVKVGSYNQYIVKPDWFYDGPAPDPRVFKLVSTGERKRLISKRIAKRYGTDVVSDVHCDPKDTFEIFRLEPVVPIKTIRRKSTKRKTTKRKTTKRKKTATTIKSRKVLHHRTRGRTLTAADETTAGGGRKKKRTLKKRLKRN